MATTQYIGARYVPLFFTNPDDNSNNWKSGVAYDPLTVVMDLNQSYTSKIPVPASVGRPSENPTYWILTGAYNNQVEQYRQEVENYKDLVERHVLAWINALDIGCVNDGVTDNRSVLNAWFANHPDKILYFPEGTYLTTGEIDTLGGIIMDWNATIKAAAAMDCVVHINRFFTPAVGEGYPAEWNKQMPLILNIDCNKLAETGVRTEQLAWCNVKLMVADPVTYGVEIGYVTSAGDAENNMDIYVYCTKNNQNNNATAVRVHSADNRINSIFADTIKKALRLEASADIGIVHHWVAAQSAFDDSVTVEIADGIITCIDTLVLDTVETGIKYVDAGNTSVSSLIVDKTLGLWNNAYNINGTFYLVDASALQNTPMQQDTLKIGRYRGNSGKTSGNINVVNGILPYDTTLEYSNDWQNPRWNYSLNYAPAGCMRYNTNDRLQGSPSGIPEFTSNLVTVNTPYGKIQTISRAQSSNQDTIEFWRRDFSKYGGSNRWGHYVSDDTTTPVA